MKAFLIKLNTWLEGFRGLIAIWLPICVAYADTLFANITSISKTGIIAAAQLAIVPTVKLIWTDAIPKIVTLYNKWLKT